MNKTSSTPFDFRSSLLIPNWQDNFITLVDELQIDAICNEQDKRIINYLNNMSNNIKRDNFLLSLPFLIQRINGCIVALFAAEGAKKNSLQLTSVVPYVNFIVTGDKQYLDMTDPKFIDITHSFEEKRLKTAFLRRIIRTASWEKPWRLFKTVFYPNIYALGHSKVLIEHARKSDERIYFFQSNELTAKIFKNSNKDFSPPYLNSLVSDFITTLTGHIKIKSIYYDNFKILIERIIYKKVLEDSLALDACYNYTKLPKNIWISTGLAHNYRMLALAVLRRGGKVTSFGHATGTVFAPTRDSLFYGEFAVTNDFIDITKDASDLLKSYFFDKYPSAINSPFQISGANNNSTFKNKVKKKSKNKKPTVIYTSNTVLDIERCTPFSHSMAYFNWQLKLTDILDKMNINLICQPHPEGIFAMQDITHPLRKKYHMPKARFDDVKDQADVFLVDFVHSTTFGEILVTDKPIVRINWNDDSNYIGVAKHIKVLLDKRCRSISACFQECGSLEVNEEELNNAILTNWQEKVDSTDFRKLLLGK